jgi:hypothetical protein
LQKKKLLKNDKKKSCSMADFQEQTNKPSEGRASLKSERPEDESQVSVGHVPQEHGNDEDQGRDGNDDESTKTKKLNSCGGKVMVDYGGKNDCVSTPARSCGAR